MLGLARWRVPDRLLPAGLCDICRRWTRGAWCEDCLARHAAWRPRCGRCARPLPTPLADCPDCMRDPPPFDGVDCAVDYGFPWDRVLSAFKYDDRVELAAPCASLLWRALTAPAGVAAGAPAGWPDLLLPVPVGAERLQRRGYNQAWELARRLAVLADRPASAQVLVRLHESPPQASLSRAARRRNLRGAFGVDRPRMVAGRRIALVDDVLTTGATAAEAALTLRRHGAEAVRVWAVARTP